VSQPRETPRERTASQLAPEGRESSDAPRPEQPRASAVPRNTTQAKVVESQELKPGEEVKLPWDLPVVEDGGAQPEKKR